MTQSKSTVPEVNAARTAAENLLEKVIEEVAKAASRSAGPSTRLFFPNGIESISITVKSGNLVEVHLDINGARTTATERRELMLRAEVTADAQKVIDSCEAHWDAFSGDCSGFVKAVAGDFNITLTGQADDIVDKMNGADWNVLADGPAAKDSADAGNFVLAGLKGADHTPPRAHGHVVVVVSGPLAQGKYPTAYWGTLGGQGKKNTTLNYAWNAADRDNVIYRSKSL